MADVAALAPLFDAYRVFYGQESRPDESAEFLRRRLEAGDSQVFVAEQEGAGEGAVVGFAQLYPLLSSVSMRRVWVLNDLYTAEGHRGGGVAGALLERAAAFLRETGAARLELKTARDNRAAQSLYEKHGWRREDVFIDYVLPAGVGE